MDDYAYTVNQSALILNKSDKTIRSYIAEGQLQATKKIEAGSGIEKVFISARSLAELANARKISLNFEALERYTTNQELLADVFLRRPSQFEAPKAETSSPSISSAPSPQPAEENLVIVLLREQIGKLETEKEEMKRDLKEKDRQIEDKNLSLIQATKDSSEQYQLIALAREQAEARLSRLLEHTRILHLSTNRDIRRLQEGKLQAGDLSLLPLPSEVSTGDYEATPPEPEDFVPEAAPERDTVFSVAVDPTPAPPPSPEKEPEIAPREPQAAEAVSAPERKTPKKEDRRKRPEKTSSEKAPAKEISKKKKGFFRRIFGS